MSAAPIYAFFDFDGTLIEGDSILYWLRFYYRRRPLRIFSLIPAMLALVLRALGLISTHTLKRVALWPMSYEKPGRLDALAKDFVRQDLAFRLRQPVLDRLREHHRKGHRIVVISASASFYLRHLQSLLPSSCVFLGTELEWGVGFLGMPVYRGGNLREENKIHRLKELGFGDAGRGGFAYSDHHHDIPLLSFVEFPTCVQPTAKLRKVALASGWPIWDL